MTFTPLVPQDDALLKGYIPIQIVQCPKSQKIKRQNRWIQTSLHDELLLRVKKAIQPAAHIQSLSIEVRKETIELTVIGTLHDHTLTQQYDIPYKILSEICPQFAKEHSQYFEAIVQLRTSTKQVESYTKDLFVKAKQKGVFITKTIRKKEGVDMYVTSTKTAKAIVKQVQQRFGGLVQSASKLFSYNRETSKKMYRTTINYTGFLFSTHSVVELENNYYWVQSLMTKATLVDLRTNKKLIIDAKHAKSAQPLQKQKVIVSRLKPTLHALHPVTHQEVQALFLPDSLSTTSKKKVDAYVIEDDVYVLLK